MEQLTAIAQQFTPAHSIVAIEEYGSGNVNDTYRVTTNDARAPYFILQRINTRVFQRPELIMLNLTTFTEHVRHKLACETSARGRRWQVPRVLARATGENFFVAPDDSFWRALSFIDHSQSYNQINDLAHAREIGYALGKFHSLISDLPTDRLHDTLEGFHITPRYLQQCDEARAKFTAPHSPLIDYCFEFVQTHRALANVLEDAKAQHRLHLRPIHGDPKVNNIMIDNATGEAISMVDLDTVKPGLVHYDIGDCLRSCCNPLGEETTDFDVVRFEPTSARAVLEGYLSIAKEFLDDHDRAYLFDAIVLLPFELGIRFFADYLAGNVYFKVKHAEHNLYRAVVQFKLTASIQAQADDIRAMIQELQ